MLNHQERTALLDIEHRLVADDPSWVRAFDATAQRVARQRAHEMGFHVVAVMVWTAMSVLMVVADAAGPAMFFATLAGLSVWLIRRLRRPARTDPATGTATSRDPGDAASGRAPA